MEIEYSLQPEDFQAFERYHGKFRKGRTQPSLLAIIEMIAILVLSVGIAFGLPILLPSYRGGEVLFFILGWCAGLVAAGVCQARLQYWIARESIKERCEDRLSSWTAQDIRVIVSPSQLRTISRMTETHYHWSAFWHIAVTANHVFLYYTRHTALAIPRRAFRDAAQCEEFVALVRQYKEAWPSPEPKPTGIITSLPPDPASITRHAT